jgi:hypothetical protein
MTNKTKSILTGWSIILALLLAIFTLFIINKQRPVTSTAPAEYQIEYREPLTNAQKAQLSRAMINGFSPSCRPNSILVGQVVVVKTPSDCISAIDLKAVSDRCLGQIGRIDEVKTIKLNGTTIFTND